MKTTHRQKILAAALAGLCVWAAAATHAQDQAAVADHLTLAPPDANSSSGSGAGDDQKDKEAELAKELQNPVANLISVPIQSNWDFGIGPANATKYTANIQPVMPSVA